MKHIFLTLQILFTSFTFGQNSRDLTSISRIQSGFPCNPNSFWAIDSAGQIFEFQKASSSIINNGIVLSSPSGLSLAYSNNLNGGPYSPTFYSHIFNITSFDNFVLMY